MTRLIFYCMDICNISSSSIEDILYTVLPFCCKLRNAAKLLVHLFRIPARQFNQQAVEYETGGR